MYALIKVAWFKYICLTHWTINIFKQQLVYKFDIRLKMPFNSVYTFVFTYKPSQTRRIPYLIFSSQTMLYFVYYLALMLYICFVFMQTAIITCLRGNILASQTPS